MKGMFLFCVLSFSLGTVCTVADAKVFFRVAPSPLPPADKTGIQRLVLVWPLRDSSIVAQLHAQGYEIWFQCDSKDVAAAVSTVDRHSVEGLVVSSAARSNQVPSIEEIRSYATAQKDLMFRILIPRGRQPQLKGRLIVERDGIFQVSSPSTQPWLDTNLAIVKLARAKYPDSIPLIYDFHWDVQEAPLGSWHPDAEDYALAIAEAEAIRSDVIVDLPASLQKALATGDSEAWSLWNRVIPYLNFSSHAPSAIEQQVANLGVIVDDAQASYEAINLMARHNMAFEAVPPSSLTPARLAKWNSVIVFCALNKEAAEMLRDFAARGAIVVLVNSKGELPWHSAPPLRRESHTSVYAVGTGQIIELGEPVTDPENFARDLRRLIGGERSALALWNSLTTLVTGYREQVPNETILHLVNYADQPDNVQVHVKGHFGRVRLESPTAACCVSLPFVERNGFTEFTVPSLRIAARVHLDSEAQNSTAR